MYNIIFSGLQSETGKEPEESSGVDEAEVESGSETARSSASEPEQQEEEESDSDSEESSASESDQEEEEESSESEEEEESDSDSAGSTASESESEEASESEEESEQGDVPSEDSDDDGEGDRPRRPFLSAFSGDESPPIPPRRPRAKGVSPGRARKVFSTGFHVLVRRFLAYLLAICMRSLFPSSDSKWLRTCAEWVLSAAFVYTRCFWRLRAGVTVSSPTSPPAKLMCHDVCCQKS